tara:strand:- start:162 stop:350 length:189 start_codon:yes stop_codon:yes gene_type:complete
MFDFIAYFSTRLQTALSVLTEAEDIFVAVEDILHDKGSDPAVQVVLNDIRDLMRKLQAIRGE